MTLDKMVLNQIEKDINEREAQPLELLIEELVKLDNDQVTAILTSFLSEA
tara:strand:- start:15025 stop:15174 length:150 start_codon:yes stop_codon:yes gene_type:complete